MKNELDSIYERSREIVHELMGGIPLSLYDAEMETLHCLTDELLTSMGYDTNDRDPNYTVVKELRKALMNMYFLGKIFGELEHKDKK
jgi:hypothetical protein